MKEAAVEKHCDLDACEEHVRPNAQGTDIDSVIDPIAEAQRMKRSA